MTGDAVGAVLVGGESRRMGRDKARLPFAGVALAARALETLRAVFEEVALVTGEGSDYSDLGCIQIRDRFPGAGPLAGVEAACAWAGERPALVLACDMPGVGLEVVSRMAQRVVRPSRRVEGRAMTREGGAAAWAQVAVRDGRVQPLCGIYSPHCGAVAAGLLAAGRRSVHGLLASIDVDLVSFDDVEADPFPNVNTPADYEALGGAPAAARRAESP